jgi:hypothetical protein
VVVERDGGIEVRVFETLGGVLDEVGERAGEIL